MASLQPAPSLYPSPTSRLEALVKYCSDFPGECCFSCHDDADEGYGCLLEVYDEKGELEALVCCKKYDLACPN
jgi:hypothetical protein